MRGPIGATGVRAEGESPEEALSNLMHEAAQHDIDIRAGGYDIEMSWANALATKIKWIAEAKEA